VTLAYGIRIIDVEAREEAARAAQDASELRYAELQRDALRRRIASAEARNALEERAERTGLCACGATLSGLEEWECFACINADFGV
jgi:hypothetical protein